MTRRRGKGAAGRRLKVLRMVPKPEAQAAEPTQTAIEMLEDLLGQFKAGTLQPPPPDQMLIFWMEEHANGRSTPHVWRQNCVLAHQIAYGMMLQDLGLREWRGEIE